MLSAKVKHAVMLGLHLQARRFPGNASSRIASPLDGPPL